VVNPNQTGKRRKALCALLLCSLSSCDRHNPTAAEREGRRIHQQLRHGSLAEVEESSRKSAARWRDRPSSDAYVTFRLLESEVFLARQDGFAANAVLTTLQPTSDYLRARRDLDVVEALFRCDEYDKAEHLLQRVRTDQSADLQIHAFNLQGQLLSKRERYPEADEAYRAALQKAETSNDSYWKARVLNNLGMTRLYRGRYDDALPYFEQALEAIDKENAPLASVFLSNQAICYSELGDLDRSLTLRMQALTTQEKGDPTEALMNSYGEIGRLYDKKNDPRKAIEYYRRALSLGDRLHIKSDAATWAINLSLADVELQDWTDAEKAARLARQLDPRQTDDLRLYEDLSSAATAAGRGDRAEAQRKYMAVAAAPSGNLDTKWTAYDELGKLSASAGESRQANQNFEKAIALITESRSALSADDHKITFLSQPIQIYQDYVDALIDQGDNHAAMLAADSSRAQTMLGDMPVKTTARELQRVAAVSNSVLVSYWLTPRRSLAWIVTAGGVEQVQLPENEPAIRALVNDYRDEILNSSRDPLTNPNSAGWKLSAMVLRPLEDRIPAGSHVIGVLDGPLHDIPLETLPVSRQQPQYWLERVTFSVAPSLASLIVKTGPAERATGGVLAIGDPEPVGRYPKLSQAREEIASLENRFPQLWKTVLTGPQATAERYRQEQPERFSLIHFAAHAEANSVVPLDSAVILSPQNGEYKLYARDIANPLHPLRAQLVTISGCTSAGAKSYYGEGLIGLEWAFLHAGARNVVAALWEADDVSTARLMNRFYAQLEAGNRPADSLRAAKLELVRAKRTPYYWGPFQVYRRNAE
jgi:CHAT domain-containing protein